MSASLFQEPPRSARSEVSEVPLIVVIQGPLASALRHPPNWRPIESMFSAA